MPDDQKLVKVNGLGVVSFPADMPDEEVNDFIRTQLKSANQGKPVPVEQGHQQERVHQSVKAEFPMQTEQSEHKRQLKSEPLPKLPPLGQKIVKRKENWADKVIPYSTGIAQFIAGQAVGLSKIGRAIDKSLGIGKPMVVGMGVYHLPSDSGDVEIPAIKRFDEKMNKKIQDFAEEGPSSKEEARGQVIAAVVEFDLGEEELEAIAEAIKDASWAKNVFGIEKITEYLKKYKTLVYARNMSARTLKSSLLGGMQELVNNGGDVDKALEEAKASAKMGVAFEAGGLGVSKTLGSKLGREASVLESAAEEGKALRGVEADARREEQLENIDEYATVGVTEDPLHAAVASPKGRASEAPSEKIATAGKKTTHIIKKFAGEGEGGKGKNKEELTEDQKRRLNELRIIDELRAATRQLQNTTGMIAR